MLHITWLGHSGFIVETTGRRLVFDLFQNANLLAAPIDGKPLVFFASHGHGDHYNPEIFDHPGNLYILGSDIPRKKIPPTRHAVEQLEPGQVLLRDGLQVEAFGSTDAGVSFRVTVDGYCLFHAGDLNCWYWEEESTLKELQDDEAAWRRELAKINDGTDVDVAFFPVDPRLEQHIARGSREFVQVIRPKIFIPMHYPAGSVDVAAALGDITDKQTTTMTLFPLQPGWTWDIDDM